jgi:hypothetical protein
MHNASSLGWKHSLQVCDCGSLWSSAPPCESIVKGCPVGIAGNLDRPQQKPRSWRLCEPLISLITDQNIFMSEGRKAINRTFVI